MFDRLQQQQQQTATRAPGRSRYAGIQCGADRVSMLEPGRYRVQIASAAEGHNPGTHKNSYKVTLYVLTATESSLTPYDSSCIFVCTETPKGMNELKRWAVASAGFGPQSDTPVTEVAAAKKTGEEAYDALDSQVYYGSILEATAGQDNGAPSLCGRIVDVKVARGKPIVRDGVETEDYWREYTWYAVPESEQPK